MTNVSHFDEPRGGTDGAIDALVVSYPNKISDAEIGLLLLQHLQRLTQLQT